MSKKEIIIEQKELWEVINYSLELIGSKWGVPNGAYNQRIEVTPSGEMKLILTETANPKAKANPREVKD